jgi:hypothetical protein
VATSKNDNNDDDNDWISPRSGGAFLYSRRPRLSWSMKAVVSGGSERSPARAAADR